MNASNETSNKTAPRGAAARNGESSSSTAERFSLSGPSLSPDRRTHAYRRDLADVALAGKLFAPHYAQPLERACGALATAVRSEPSDTGPIVSELLPGERFAVLEYSGGWAWGYCAHDKYVGYVEAIELVEPAEPTNIVVEASAPVLVGDDVASPTLARLPMGAWVSGHEQGSCLVAEGGCIPLSYLRPFGEHEDDPVAVAQRLLGAPYAMGGRSCHGIDCSGLVQMALSMCGIAAGRDSDQLAGAGDPMPDGKPLKRGDLIFFPGHVGLMVDDQMLIHASRSQGKVVVEPLKLVAERSEHLSGAGITDRRRIG